MRNAQPEEVDEGHAANARDGGHGHVSVPSCLRECDDDEQRKRGAERDSEEWRADDKMSAVSSVVAAAAAVVAATPGSSTGKMSVSDQDMESSSTSSESFRQLEATSSCGI